MQIDSNLFIVISFLTGLIVSGLVIWLILRQKVNTLEEKLELIKYSYEEKIELLETNFADTIEYEKVKPRLNTTLCLNLLKIKKNN